MLATSKRPSGDVQLQRSPGVVPKERSGGRSWLELGSFGPVDRNQLRSLTPADAAVALRSYGRRFRELFRTDELAGAEPGESTVDLLHPAPGSDHAPLAVVAAATRAFSSLGRAIDRTLALDRPELGEGLLDRTVRDAGTLDVAEPGPTVDALTAAAGALADVIARTPLRDWERPATVGGTPVEGMELVREAVAAGRTYLDDLAVSLDAARRAAR